jgi:AraC-like DNA-binding protein
MGTMTIPFISTTAFVGITDYIEETAGEKNLFAAFERAELPFEAGQERGRFIPQRSFINVLEQAARLSDDRNLGLGLASKLDISTWGPYGQYVLEAADAPDAFRRGKRALKFHGSIDTLDVQVSNNELTVIYKVPTTGVVGYRHFAPAAAKILMSVVEHFVEGPARPLRVEFDFAKPANWSLHEERFGCPVWFDRPNIAIVYQLQPGRSRAGEVDVHHALTLGDLHRMLGTQAPTSLPDVVKEMIRMGLASGSVDIDRVGCHLGMGVRSLQRKLAEHNCYFRDLVLQIRAERATELLGETSISITEIAMTLGYSSSAHFTRAFKQTMGCTPREFRAS